MMVKVSTDGAPPRYGHGAYFADNIDKALSYAQSDEHGRRWLLLCRVLCGELHYTVSPQLQKLFEAFSISKFRFCNVLTASISSLAADDPLYDSEIFR